MEVHLPAAMEVAAVGVQSPVAVEVVDLGMQPPKAPEEQAHEASSPASKGARTKTPEATSRRESEDDTPVEFEGECYPQIRAEIRSRPPPAQHRGHMSSLAGKYIDFLPREAKSILQSVFSAGCHLSTHFTGLEFGDFAAARVAESASPDAMLDIFHQCDVVDRSLKVLLKHTGMSRGKHVFLAVEGGWPDETMSKLKSCEAKLFAGLDSAASAEEREIIGREMLEEFMGILDNSEQNVTDYCMVHKKQCKLYDLDIEAVRSKGGVIGSLASPVCIDYSAMNQGRPGALGHTHISFACYLADRKRKHALGLEDFSLMEITTRHPSCALFDFAMPSNLILGFVLCPSLFSLPQTRKRRFPLSLSPRMIPVRVPRRCLYFPPRPLPQASGTNSERQEALHVVDSSDDDYVSPSVPLRIAGGPVYFFGCAVADGVTGSAWYFASPAFVEKFYNKLRSTKKIPKGIGRRDLLLEPSSRTHLARLRQSLSTEELVGISDLRQSDSFSPNPKLLLECLLQNCHQMWSHTLERVLLPEEALASQGLPIFSQGIPFDMDEINLDDSEWYAFAGNGVCVSCAEAVIVWTLGCFRRAPDQFDSRPALRFSA